MDSLFHFRLKGTSRAFYAADTTHASPSQIRRLIADVLSIKQTSFVLIEVRSPGPPVVFGGQSRAQDITSGLRGFYEVDVGEQAHSMKYPLRIESLQLLAGIEEKVAQLLIPFADAARLVGIGVFALFQSQKKVH